MLFNCHHCCKAISTKIERCPYCMIDTSRMVGLIEPQRNTPSSAKKLTFFMKRNAYRAERRAADFKHALPNVAQVVRGMKIAER